MIEYYIDHHDNLIPVHDCIYEETYRYKEVTGWFNVYWIVGSECKICGDWKRTKETYERR